MDREEDRAERLGALAILHEREVKHAELVLTVVKSARMAGATWEQIGKSLGITRQAAQQRFSAKMGYWLSMTDE